MQNSGRWFLCDRVIPQTSSGKSDLLLLLLRLTEVQVQVSQSHMG